MFRRMFGYALLAGYFPPDACDNYAVSRRAAARHRVGPIAATRRAANQSGQYRERLHFLVVDHSL